MWKSVSILGFCASLYLIVSFSSPVSGFRNCAEARYCCPGRNNTCFAYGPRMDNNDTQPQCFCDQECREMNDCCTDYKQTCEGADCLVTEWGEWGLCEPPCGYGTQKRGRQILRKRQHNGKKCPVRREKRACFDNSPDRCQVQSVEYQAKELSEVARILPAPFGRHRESSEYNMKYDIRRNLFDRVSNEVPKRLGYCAIFKITGSRIQCNMTERVSGPGKEWAKTLQAGNKVCVQCDPFAMNKELGMRCIGHGVYQHVTRWKAVDVKFCNGFWEMIEKHSDCVCNQHPDYDFILI